VHRSNSVDGFIHRFFRIVGRRSVIASQQLPMARLTVQHYSSFNFYKKQKKQKQTIEIRLEGLFGTR
jgi:hypothetical protein